MCELNTRIIHQQGPEEYKNDEHPFGDVPAYIVRPQDIMFTHHSSTLARAEYENERMDLTNLQVQMRVLHYDAHTDPPDEGHDDDNAEIIGTTTAQAQNTVGWVDLTPTQADGDRTFSGPLYSPMHYLGLGPRAGQVNAQMPQM